MIPIVLSVIRIESSSIRSFGQMLDFRGCDFQDVEEESGSGRRWMRPEGMGLMLPW